MASIPRTKTKERGKYRLSSQANSSVLSQLNWYKPLTTENKINDRLVKIIQDAPGLNNAGAFDATSPDIKGSPEEHKEYLQAAVSVRATRALLEDKIVGDIRGQIADNISRRIGTADPDLADSELITDISRGVSSYIARKVSAIYVDPAILPEQKSQELKRMVSEVTLSLGQTGSAEETKIRDAVFKELAWKDDDLGITDRTQGFRSNAHIFGEATLEALREVAQKTDKHGKLINLEQERVRNLEAEFSPEDRLVLRETTTYYFGDKSITTKPSDYEYSMVPVNERGKSEAFDQAVYDATEQFNTEYGQTIDASKLSLHLSNLYKGKFDKLFVEFLTPLPSRQKTQIEKEIDTYLTGRGVSKRISKEFKKKLKNSVGVWTGVYQRPTKLDTKTGIYRYSKNAVFSPYVWMAKQLGSVAHVFGAGRSGIYGGALGFALGGPIGGIVGSLTSGLVSYGVERGVKKWASASRENLNDAGVNLLKNTSNRGALYGNSDFDAGFGKNIDVYKNGRFLSKFDYQRKLLLDEEFFRVLRRKKKRKDGAEESDYSSTPWFLLKVGGSLVALTAKAAFRHILKIPYHQTLSDWWKMQESINKSSFVGGSMQNLRFLGYFSKAWFKSLPGGALGFGIGYLGSGGSLGWGLFSGGLYSIGKTFNTLLEANVSEARKLVLDFDPALFRGDAGFVQYGRFARIGNWFNSKALVGINAEGGLGKFLYSNGARINRLHIPVTGGLIGYTLGALTGHPWEGFFAGIILDYGSHWIKGFIKGGFTWLVRQLLSLGEVAKMRILAEFPSLKVFFEFFGKYGKYFKSGGIAFGSTFIVSQLLGLPLWASLLVATGATGLTVGVQSLLLKKFPWLEKTPIGKILGSAFGKIFNAIFRVFSVFQTPQSLRELRKTFLDIKDGKFGSITIQKIWGVFTNLLTAAWGGLTSLGFIKGFIDGWRVFSQQISFWKTFGGLGAGSAGTQIRLFFQQAGSALWQGLKTALTFGLRNLGYLISSAATATGAFASEIATAVGAAVGGVFAAIGVIILWFLFAVAVIGGAIFMVTVAQNRANPPASTKISVSKTMVVAGDSIKATVVLTNISTEK
ncbi:MAG: hypothetical protein ABII16_03555, partial [Patescibacteria group bacterium]